MNDSTRAFLKRLWNDPDVSIKGRYQRFSQLLAELEPVEMAILGRDLIARRFRLFNPKFYLAAFLATESLTGNDGFLDFTDCTAVLPEDRYDRVLTDPDCLIDDPILKSWDEVGFVNLCLARFDEFFGLDPYEHLLDYLMHGGERPNQWLEMQRHFTSRNAQEWLPRLYARSGHLLKQ